MWAGLLCVLLLGCGGESEFPVTQLEDGSVEIDHSGLPQQNLQGELLVSTEIIGDPRYASVVGRQLWISDRAGDPWLHVIDLEADSIVISFGRTGEGPGDFSEVPQLSNRLHDSGGIWAYDARLRRLTRLSTRPDEPVDIRTSLDGSVGHVWSFLWQGPDSIIGIGDVDSSRIVIADSSGRLVRFVPRQLLGPDSASLESRRSISSAYVACAQPEAGRLAILYLAAGLIELYQSDGTYLTSAKVPYANSGVWIEDERGRINFSKDWYYYVSCTPSRRFLYALFSGRRSDGVGGPTARAARFVHVFDWDGNLKSILALDRELSTVAVDGDTVLYGTGQNADGVFRFLLPTLQSKEPK